MQDRYVGDIGDFANNGLLRFLCGVTGPKMNSPLRLGEVWCLNRPDDNRDGKRTDYLCETKPWHTALKNCDRNLFKELYRLVKEGKRNVKEAMDGKRILPKETEFYSNYLPASSEERNKWLSGALQATEKSDIVFFNPDNGLDLNEATRNGKHISVTEVQYFIDQCKRLNQDKSLIIYQHQDRSEGGSVARINKISELLQKRLPGYSCRALSWHREISRHYFILAHSKHEDILKSRIKTFLESSWGKERPRRNADPHFTLAYPLGDL